LTEEEWAEVKKVEEKNARKISSLIYLSAQGREIEGNVLTLRRGDGSVEINLGFRLIITNPHPLVIHGDSVPPLAVSIAIDKIWEEFERVAFVQSKTLR
jgi:hypothetical protein